jgi:hypothetical protein
MRYLIVLTLLCVNICYANYAIVDFRKPSTEKRFFIYTDSGTLLFSTYTSHGSGSGRGLYPDRFSNVIGSKASSLGTFRIKELHYGKHGKSYRLEGLSSTNSNAYIRLIEIHGADYIGDGKTGTSWGCFAVPFTDLDTVMTLLQPGDYLYARS